MAPPTVGKKIIVRISLAHADLIGAAPGNTTAEKVRWIIDDYMRIVNAKRNRSTTAATTP